jgi:hypothetical protein
MLTPHAWSVGARIPPDSRLASPRAERIRYSTGCGDSEIPRIRLRRFRYHFMVWTASSDVERSHGWSLTLCGCGCWPDLVKKILVAADKVGRYRTGKYREVHSVICNDIPKTCFLSIRSGASMDLFPLGVASTYSHATLSLQKRVLLIATQIVIATDHGTQRSKGRIDTA